MKEHAPGRYCGALEARRTEGHSEHGAVDTTFVQFYPTLLPAAKNKGTLAAAYLKEIAAPDQK